ncbi:protein-L-isoaspartate O-methyltransferase domain-containing protein 2 [Acyrthosiphon pisum]|uniref:Uncharacterized protein n=1 Tax=Acyrthosiphon pisum TaxID=7029 RepID=A0A8R2F821_ACYPI|nr:protein-L-isoaspartate O-methyltransferase domain-containing protein 2 [Acyrthosiphon pisum]XP_016658048.1 protein-L-isoaspartate O-methyltransferase domain-containing protein 2 [Acyrthosiphon pisum]|eukprot:XP_008180749.1 PREDICTED: protein-L-isoaspartate O-methyltransferase domain-containing protein 2-like [Acyrthosiphon pisum]
MGQYESTNRLYNSNVQLVDMLILRQCIHSINVEKVLRSVDRGLYYTNDSKLDAYRDADWQSGDVHLFSPSHYAIVLECLDLHKGHKFLNIGSGIGYFSTLAGLLLGISGVNHGIEIHSSLVDIAYQKLEEFKENCAAIDYFEFCEPVFIKGNAFELLPMGYYDRVYCGPGVPPAQALFMMDLIKIGGVLVMPSNGALVKVTREGELSWKTIEVLQVSIPPLVMSEKNRKVLKFPTVQPLSLKELCRSNIRASIRDCLIESHPDLQMHIKCKPNISFDQKLLNETRSGMMSLRSVVDMIYDHQTSDLDSTSEDETTKEDNDDDKNGRGVDVEEKNTSEQCDKSILKKTASDTKRKASEAGCSSKQNETLLKKPDNTKRKRIDTSSRAVNPPDYQTTHLEFWETMLNFSPPGSSEDDYEEDDDNSEDLVDDKINNVSATVKEPLFLSNRKENEMSKLLNAKINQLPVPAVLKLYLNYN